MSVSFEDQDFITWSPYTTNRKGSECTYGINSSPANISLKFIVVLFDFIHPLFRLLHHSLMAVKLLFPVFFLPLNLFMKLIQFSCSNVTFLLSCQLLESDKRVAAKHSLMQCAHRG